MQLTNNRVAEEASKYILVLGTVSVTGKATLFVPTHSNISYLKSILNSSTL